MRSPARSVTTENPEPRGKGRACSKGIPAATDDFDAAYSDERSSRSPRPCEAPPTGTLTWVLGELAFYYGACCLYHRSAPPRWEKMW